MCGHLMPKVKSKNVQTIGVWSRRDSGFTRTQSSCCKGIRWSLTNLGVLYISEYFSREFEAEPGE